MKNLLELHIFFVLIFIIFFPDIIQAKNRNLYCTNDFSKDNVKTKDSLISNQEEANEPLYVIDGVAYKTLKYLDVSDVVSIDVLKNNDTATISGSNSVKDVILFTTKQYKAGNKYAQQYLYRARVAVEKASSFRDIFNFKAELFHLREAHNYYTKANDKQQVALRSIDIARCLTQLNAERIDIIKFYREASSIYNEFGDFLDEIYCLNNIKKLLFEQGDDESYADITQEINLKISLISPSISLFFSLGDNFYYERNYNGAIPYYEKAKALCENAGYENDLGLYITICENLMNSYYQVSSYNEAIELGNLLLNINEKKGQELPLIKLRNVYQGMLLCNLGLENKERAYEIIEIAKKKYNNHSSSIFRVIPYNLSFHLNRLTGNYEDMLKYAVLSDSILATEFNDINDNRINAKVDIINALAQLGRYKEAVSLCRQQMNVKKQIYKIRPGDYRDDLLRLSNYEAFSGVSSPSEKDSSIMHMTEYLSIIKNEIKSQATLLTSTQRNSLWGSAQTILRHATGMAIGHNSVREPFVEEAYDAHLMASGLLLQTERSIAENITMYGTEESRLAFSQFVALQDSLVYAESEKNIERQAELEIKIREAEHQLLSSNDISTTSGSISYTDFESIHSSLNKGEVLIDFLHLNEKTLAAFILRPEWKFPHLLNVVSDTIFYQFSTPLYSRLYEDGISQSFRHLVLDSVLQYVKPGELIYYVPDGVLHSVALENLKTDDGKLLSEVYNMRRLSSAREIAKIHSSKNGDYKKAVLYGSLDYGIYSINGTERKVSTGDPNNDERGVGDAYEPLRATDYEVTKIDAILKKSHIETASYRNMDGTEESFRALNGDSPDIIHLATHGYYLSADQAKKVKGLSGYTDAMLLSGLVMSGGNAGWLNVPNEDGSMDGLLSAQDISGLDLSKTKLVVLSACKTASGQNKADGIFGLQRAFKKAGAGTLILTLWGVNDQVTALFMTAFYHELAKNNWDRQKAFTNAKMQIKEQYPEPYFWAGFIMLD